MDTLLHVCKVEQIQHPRIRENLQKAGVWDLWVVDNVLEFRFFDKKQKLPFLASYYKVFQWDILDKKDMNTLFKILKEQFGHSWLYNKKIVDIKYYSNEQFNFTCWY